jgi:hypothetical protein
VGDQDTGDDYGQREFWPWLAGLALIVLVAEWWVYHRGSALPRASSGASTALRRRFGFLRRG